jgi:succinyl-diaminopimelate desuccinylase
MTTSELTEKLVKYQTTAENKEETEKALDFIEELFEDEKFEKQRFKDEGEESLLISFNKGLKPEVLLHGHIDVVEAEKDQFQPYKEDGKLYGRGTADMKSGLACFIHVMKKYAEKDMNPDIALLITSDEERGGFNGTGHLVEKGLEPEFAISAEPDDSGSFPSIVNKQKGVLQLKIEAEGKSAHGSKPEKGENAAEKLMQKYREIKNLFSEGEYVTTVNLGRFESGEVVNQVPSHAEMHLDVRYSSEYSADDVLNDIRAIDGLNVEVTARAPMLETDAEDKYVERLKSSIEKSGNEPVLRRENFASDMRFFTEKDVPAVCFGPEGYDLHGENEHVELESLSEYCEILKNFLETTLSED